MNTSTQSHRIEICQSIKLGIQRHIKFRLPNASMRRELFTLHLPNPERVRANFADDVEAYKWLNLAGAQSYEGATELRDNIAQSMTPDQIAEAQKLSRECKPQAKK